ncbi:MAG: type IV pilus modification PilV family protein, partial [Rubrobacteraceae bacterium]
MTEKANTESGYSLVEVLAAIVILTVAIIPMVAMFDTGLRSATTSGNYDKARALANSNLEMAKTRSLSVGTGLD